MNLKNNSRYPYTLACDYIRQLGDCDSSGVRISRSEASRIRQGIAKAIGMDDEELAKKLADYAEANEEEVSKAYMHKLFVGLGIPLPAESK